MGLQDRKYLDLIEGMLGHFEKTRLKDGFLPILSQYSYRPQLKPTPGANLAVGITLLEAAPLCGDTPTGAHARRLGTELLATLAAAPVTLPKQAGFAVVYGGGDFAGGEAVLRVQAYRLTQDKRHLDAARAFAELYRAVDKTPTEGNRRAEVYGLLVNLYLDLHELEPDGGWLPAAEKYARLGIEDLYYDGLFRGASNLGYYDSELYVSTFVYGLVRLQALQAGGKVAVPPLYFHR